MSGMKLCATMQDNCWNYTSLVFSSLCAHCLDGKENGPALHHFIQPKTYEISPSIVFFWPWPLFCLLHTQVCSDCMYSASSRRGTRADSVRWLSLTPKANYKKLCSFHWSLWKHGPRCLWKVCKLIIVRSRAFLHYSSIPLLLSECAHFQLRLVFNTMILPAKLPYLRRGLAPNRWERAINNKIVYKHKMWVKFSLPPTLI